MKSALLLLICLAFIFSCKKEKKEEPTVSAPPPGQTDTTATDSIPSDTLAVVSDSCYGEFCSGRSFILLPNNTLQPSATERPWVMIDSLPFLYTNGPTQGIYIDSITCNGIDYFYNGYNYLADPNLIGNLSPPLNWHVKGNSYIQGFDYTATGTNPFFAGYLGLPDTLNTHQPFQMTLTGLTGQGYVLVLVRDYALHEIKKVYKTDSSQVTISFSQTELSQLDPQSNGVLGVTLRKENLQSFHGKQFNFSREMGVATAIDLR